MSCYKNQEAPPQASRLVYWLWWDPQWKSVQYCTRLCLWRCVFQALDGEPVSQTLSRNTKLYRSDTSKARCSPCRWNSCQCVLGVTGWTMRLMTLFCINLPMVQWVPLVPLGKKAVALASSLTGIWGLLNADRVLEGPVSKPRLAILWGTLTNIQEALHYHVHRGNRFTITSAMPPSSEFLFLKRDPVLLFLLFLFPRPPRGPLKQHRARALRALLIFLLWPRLNFQKFVSEAR